MYEGMKGVFFFSLTGVGACILSWQDVLFLSSKQENTTCGTYLCTRYHIQSALALTHNGNVYV